MSLNRIVADKSHRVIVAEHYHTFSPILTSFDESEKFRAVIYPNFGVLLQEK